MTDDPRKPPTEWYTHPEMLDEESVSPDTLVKPNTGEVLHARWTTDEQLAGDTQGAATTEAQERAIDEQLSRWPTTDPDAPLLKIEAKQAFRLGAYLVAGVLLGIVALFVVLGVRSYGIDIRPAVLFAVIAGAMISAFLKL